MNDAASKEIAETYNRIAGSYDAVDRLIPAGWRRQATGRTFGRVLEVGIGTGLNLPFYTDRCRELLGIDLSAGMLARAEARALRVRLPVRLETMDVQALSLPADSFDCVLATFVFCTVPRPLAGLQECFRVLKSGGRLILLEHMGSANKLLRPLMDWLNPLTVRLLGDHINRDTVDTAVAAGFRLTEVKNLFGDIVRLAVAEK